MFFLNNIIRETFSITRKEIQIELRFAISYIFQSIIAPIGRLAPIFAVYVATVGVNAVSPIPGLTKESYIPFLVLGVIFHTTWIASTSEFQNKFRRDKWSRTIEIIFIAPVNTFAIIVGVGIAAIVQNTPTFIAFLITLLIIHPVSFSAFFLVFITFVLVTLIGLSVGLIIGAATLATENITPFIGYFVSIFTLLTPFFYPIEVIGKFPHPLNIILGSIVAYNPLNVALTFARSVWLNTGTATFFDLFYVLISAIFLVICSGYLFRFIWRKFGIQGS